MLIQLSYAKSIENIKLNAVFTFDTCFGWILPLMFSYLMCKRNEHKTFNNYIIKSYVFVNLKYIQMLLITTLIS